MTRERLRTARPSRSTQNANALKTSSCRSEEANPVRPARRRSLNNPTEVLARNLAEVIDDLYRQHAPPRDHERMIELVQHQVRRAMLMERKRVIAIAEQRSGQGLPRWWFDEMSDEVTS
jgi:hypothetical protein